MGAGYGNPQNLKLWDCSWPSFWFCSVSAMLTVSSFKSKQTNCST